MCTHVFTYLLVYLYTVLCCRRRRFCWFWCCCGSCLRRFSSFLCFALLVIALVILRTDFLIIGGGLEQFLHVIYIARVGRDLKIMIHDDRIEWTIFGAEAAVHADIRVDEEFGRLRNRAPGLWIVRADNPDTLWRTDLCANPA